MNTYKVSLHQTDCLVKADGYYLDERDNLHFELNEDIVASFSYWSSVKLEGNNAA